MMHSKTDPFTLTVTETPTPFGPARAVEMNDRLWFFAADLCKHLGITRSRDALADVARHDRRRARIHPGRGRPFGVVSEAGMFQLFLNSPRQTAQTFRHFLASEVIPEFFGAGVYEGMRGQQGQDPLTVRTR